MAKYRKCPECGTKNPPNLLACMKCGSDSLEFEKILDDSVPEITEDTPGDVVSADTIENNPQPGNMVRVCDCGAHNPVQARKCSNCGEDISDVVPTKEIDTSASAEERHYMLSSLDGNYAYEVLEHLVFIGRECEMKEYLSGKQFVSRKHAEVLVEEGNLYIKNLSTTNYTYVNNEKIEEGKYVQLKDGDELGLGGKVVNETRQEEAAYFLVRVGQCCM